MLAVTWVGGFFILILVIYCRYLLKHPKRNYAVQENEAFIESNGEHDEDILRAPAQLNT